jgi:hypothetical protein
MQLSAANPPRISARGSNQEILTTSKCLPVCLELRTSASATGMSQLVVLSLRALQSPRMLPAESANVRPEASLV